MLFDQSWWKQQDKTNRKVMKIEEGINSNPTEHPKQTSINEEFLFIYFALFPRLNRDAVLLITSTFKKRAEERFQWNKNGSLNFTFPHISCN